MKTIRVLLADDHDIVRAGLRALLNTAADMQVVAEANNGNEALRLVELHQPDIVLMDISMPGLNGLEATRQIKKQAPHVKVLVLSAHDSEDCIVQVMQSGADGYLLKSSAAGDLYAAVRSVHHGQAFFSPSVSRVLLEEYRKTVHVPAESDQVQAGGSRLTAREREILQLVAEGAVDPSLPGLVTDRNGLKQVLINLLSNAIKYSPEGSEVILGARLEDNTVTLWVKDEGIGIPSESLDRIFDMFYRVEGTSKRQITGTGLGLALVKEIVCAHKGQVWVESTLGQGSTFYISLPVARINHGKATSV